MTTIYDALDEVRDVPRARRVTRPVLVADGGQIVTDGVIVVVGPTDINALRGEGRGAYAIEIIVGRRRE